MVDRYQLLADWLVGREAGPVGGEAEWVELVALAQAEGVGPLLDHSLRARPEVAVPAAARHRLASIYGEAACISLLYRSVRARLCERLGERGIPVLLLKGAALAFTLYDDPATRPMADLDLLVPKSRVEEAARCLEEEGFRLHLLPRSLIPSMNRPHVHLIYVHPVTRAVAELHWELQALRNAPADALAEVWAHARPAECGGTARVMDLAQILPFLCAHMTLQHKWVPMTGLFDLHRVLLAISAADAARVPDVAARWHLAPCTAHSLLRVRELLDTPLSEELQAWATEVVAQNSLQARVAALALVPGAPEMPHDGLVRLLMNREWRLLRSLFPAPEVLRERLGLGAHESVVPAYVALIARRLGSSPAHFRRLWRCWRAASRSQRDGAP